MEILNDLKNNEKIINKDFFRISRVFLKESEYYWALFFGMSADMRVEREIIERNLRDLHTALKRTDATNETPEITLTKQPIRLLATIKLPI